MAKALIQKNQDIAEQNEEVEIESLLEQFEKDISLFHEFVAKLNFYEKRYVNDWSSDRETVTIVEYLDICKTKFDKGFTTETSRRLLELLDSLCKWSTLKLSPVLTEMSHKLSEVNTTLTDKNEKLVDEIIDLKKQISKFNSIIEQNKVLENNNTQLLEDFNELYNYTMKVINEEEFIDEEDVKLQKRVRSYLISNKNEEKNIDNDEITDVEIELSDVPQSENSSPNKLQKKQSIGEIMGIKSKITK